MTALLQHSITRAVEEHKDAISVSTTGGDIAVAVYFDKASKNGASSPDNALEVFIDATDEHGDINIIHYDQRFWSAIITP